MSKEIVKDPDELINQAISAFSKARAVVADAIELLYEVYKTEAWEGRFDSWTEFCEDGLKISQSLGSQYVAVYEHYVKSGVLTVNRLGDANIANLYKARQLPGSPEEQYTQALTLSRGEIEGLVAEEKNPNCQHPNTIVLCTDCKRRL